MGMKTLRIESVRIFTSVQEQPDDHAPDALEPRGIKRGTNREFRLHRHRRRLRRDGRDSDVPLGGARVRLACQAEVTQAG